MVRMCGQIYHNYASLYPANDALPPSFNQIYIYQQSDANEFLFLNRVTGGCTPNIFAFISDVLEQLKSLRSLVQDNGGRTQNFL